MKPDELRERIERSGVSGRQIARALGVERAQPSNWCRGVKPIPERHVPRILELTGAWVFDVSPRNPCLCGIPRRGMSRQNPLKSPIAARGGFVVRLDEIHVKRTHHGPSGGP